MIMKTDKPTGWHDRIDNPFAKGNARNIADLGQGE
jgi:hypothetical protein